MLCAVTVAVADSSKVSAIADGGIGDDASPHEPRANDIVLRLKSVDDLFVPFGLNHSQSKCEKRVRERGKR